MRSIKVLMLAILVAALPACGGGTPSGNDNGEGVCAPETKKCDGSDIVKCNSAGDEWSFFKECEDGCKDGGCLPPSCEPNCTGKTCGADGCGGSCGQCSGGGPCTDGSCCTPSCLTPGGGKAICGDDGCGGTCGACPADTPLCEDGLCAPVCVPGCDGRECGTDGCGGVCGICPDAAPLCEEGKCEPVCKPDCSGRECGSNGCGGTCGECDGGEQCEKGNCECVPQCDGKECGIDGCGGVCGKCSGQDTCEDGKCECQPACNDAECGPDGCGETCGVCQEGAECTEGICWCEPESDTVCCGDAICWLDSCGVEGEVKEPCAVGCNESECLVPVTISLWMEEMLLGPADLEGVAWDCIPIPFLDDCKLEELVVKELIATLGLSNPWTAIIGFLGSALIAEVKKPDPFGNAEVWVGGQLVSGLTLWIPGKDDTLHPQWVGLGWQEIGTDPTLVIKVLLEDYDPANDDDPFGIATISMDAILAVMNSGEPGWVEVASQTSNTLLAVKISAYPMSLECVPDCNGKVCGADGCGGSCGNCQAGFVCLAGGLCAEVLDDCNGVSFEGCCEGQKLVWCEEGSLQSYSCDETPTCGWDGEYGFYNCGTDGAEDPSGVFVMTCPPDACIPNCDGSDCGDDGCEGSCGVCNGGDVCQNGACVEQEGCGPVTYEGCCSGATLKYCDNNELQTLDCTGNPSCGWQVEGNFYDCGTAGGSDPAGTFPKSCGACVPNCAGKDCGDNGCGGSCGTCQGGQVCQDGACVAQGGCGSVTYEGCCSGASLKYCEDGQLQAIDCTDNPNCGWQADGNYYNCGTAGGSDPSGQNPKSCDGGCNPSCAGKQCGSDGCGGSCGTCLAGNTCVAGNCVATQVCDYESFFAAGGEAAGYSIDYELLSYQANASAGIPTDLLTLELYSGYGGPTQPGLYAAADGNYSTCGLCAMVWGQCTEEGCQKGFLATEGSVDITSIGQTGDWIAGTLYGVTFQQVWIDPDTYVSTPVPGGETWCIEEYSFSSFIDTM